MASKALEVRSIRSRCSFNSRLNKTGNEEQENLIGRSAVTETKPISVRRESEL